MRAIRILLALLRICLGIYFIYVGYAYHTGDDRGWNIVKGFVWNAKEQVQEVKEQVREVTQQAEEIKEILPDIEEMHRQAEKRRAEMRAVMGEIEAQQKQN